MTLDFDIMLMDQAAIDRRTPPIGWELSPTGLQKNLEAPFTAPLGENCAGREGEEQDADLERLDGTSFSQQRGSTTATRRTSGRRDRGAPPKRVVFVLTQRLERRKSDPEQ